MSEVNIKQTEKLSASLEKPQVINGAGIRSIEQTTTSSEDGGANEITINLTDGTSQTFEVRNGSKGSTGEKGERGQKGDSGVLSVNGVAPDDKGNVEVQSGAQSDWNQNDSQAFDYVKNRPGGYFTTIEPTTIAWDGSVDGKTKIDIGVGGYYLVSSNIVTIDQFAGGSYTIVENNALNNNEIKKETIQILSDGIFTDDGGMVLVAHTTGDVKIFGIALNVSEPGIYFAKIESESYSAEVTSFTISRVQVLTPIPMQYIENADKIMLSSEEISSDLVIGDGVGICSNGDKPTKFKMSPTGASITNSQSSDLWFAIGLGDDSNSNIGVHISKTNSYVDVFVPNIASGTGNGQINLNGSYVSELGYSEVGLSGISNLSVSDKIVLGGSAVLSANTTTGELGIGLGSNPIKVVATKEYVDTLIGGIENGTY